MKVTLLLLSVFGAAVTVQGKGQCVDKMLGCHILTKRGWCQHRADQMKIKCRKTCGFCGAKPRKQVLYSLPAQTCTDKSKSCNFMKTRGWCKHRKAHMQIQCRETCQFCKTKCEDKRPDCNGLKKIGFCSKKANKMYKMCKKTCSMCSNTETNEIETNSAKPNGGCVDTFGQKRCEYYAHIGMCTKKQKFKKICHNTCVCNFKKPQQHTHCRTTKHGCCWDNKTTKKDVYGSTCPVCKDDPRFEVLCSRFGEDCKGSGGLARSVRKHCPKTCHFC